MTAVLSSNIANSTHSPVAPPAILPDRMTEHSTEEWRVLRALCVYRLVMAPILAAIFFSGEAPDFLSLSRPGLFQAMTYAWFASGSLLMIALVSRTPPFEHQVALHAGSDLIAVSGLLLASSGVGSGLGMLLLIPVLGLSMVLPPRLATLTAAVGTFVLFAVELSRQYPSDWTAGPLTQAGVLGAAMFVVAVSASTVAVRARRSEARAEQAGSALSDLSRINDTIVATMRSGVLVVDENLRVRTLNEAARDLLRARGGVTGQDLRYFAPDIAEDIERWRQGMTSAPVRMGTRDLVLRYTALGPGEQSPVLVLVEDAQRARDEAQRLKLAALGRLSASIAHEIRNPLSAITQATELLEATQDDQEADALRRVIRRHAKRIDGIVQDVTDISRGRPPEPDNRPLSELLGLAYRQFQEGDQNSARQVTLHLDTDAVSGNTIVHFDSDHFCRILLNLWRNSVEHGARTIRMRALPAAARILLHIRDDGKGIEPGMTETIFEPFYTTSTKGTGLGLYLARTLCEANGALLFLQPDDGPGAHFVLQMPASVRSAVA